MVMYWILCIIFIVIQAFDVWSTSTILRRGGKELNKVMSWLIDKVGVMPALIYTKCLSSALVVICGIFLPMYSTLINVMLSIVCAFYVVMLAKYNAKSIFKRT